MKTKKIATILLFWIISLMSNAKLQSLELLNNKEILLKFEHDINHIVSKKSFQLIGCDISIREIKKINNNSIILQLNRTLLSEEIFALQTKNLRKENQIQDTLVAFTYSTSKEEVKVPNPIIVKPYFTSILLENPNILVIKTSSKMDSVSVTEMKNYFLGNGRYKLSFISLNKTKRTLKLQITPKFNEGILTISTTDRLKNFASISYRDTTVKLQSPLPIPLVKVELVDKDKILIVSNKILDFSTTLKENHYELVGENLFCDEISLNTKRDSVFLKLNRHLFGGESLQLRIRKLIYENGIRVSDTLVDLKLKEEPQTFYPFDLVINEVMADPQDSVLLPEIEYVELFNRRDYPLKIVNWAIEDETKEIFIPEVILESGEYLLLTKTGSCFRFSDSIKCVEIKSFPTLNNNKDVVKILDAEQQVIDELHYFRSWLGASYKKDGGWSLERIDPNNKLNNSSNWRVSEQKEGGTPGYLNSIAAINKDKDGPLLQNILYKNKTEIVLVFSETIKSDLVNSTNFSFSPDVGSFELKVKYNEIFIYFKDALKESNMYDITIDGLEDLNNNIMNLEKRIFGIPEQIEVGDILINEILFNPKPNGHDYIEIINKSNKVLDLSQLVFFSVSHPADYPERLYTLSSVSRLILPNSIISFHADDINLPPLPDNDSYLALTSKFDVGTFIDLIYYNEDMHSPFLEEKEGVSLERLTLTEPAISKYQWQSASFFSGFGTPGVSNSQIRHSNIDMDEKVKISNKTFSPNGDGNNDQLEIIFKLDNPGWYVTISIFDSRGVLQAQLIDNRSVVNEDRIVWNGGGDLTLMPVGLYIIYVKLYNANFGVETKKFIVAINE